MEQFTTPTGIACVVMAALLLAGLTGWGLSYVFAVRRYEMGAGQAFTSIGMPAWLTQGLFSLAVGDKARGFEQLKAAADRAVTPAGLAEIDLGYVASCRANPARWPGFFKLVSDANANASQQTLQADAQSFASSSPMLQIGQVPTAGSVLKSDVSSWTDQLGQAADALQTVAAHPHLAGFHTIVAANPALAAQAGSVLKIAAAASTATQAAAATPATATPAPAASATAPAASATAPAASIPVPSGGTVTIQHP